MQFLFDFLLHNEGLTCLTYSLPSGMHQPLYQSYDKNPPLSYLNPNIFLFMFLFVRLTIFRWLDHVTISVVSPQYREKRHSTRPLCHSIKSFGFCQWVALVNIPFWFSFIVLVSCQWMLSLQQNLPFLGVVTLATTVYMWCQWHAILNMSFWMTALLAKNWRNPKWNGVIIHI